MANTNHKRQHTYRVSFQDDVGSSWDPDMENWEQELRMSHVHFICHSK